MYYVRALGNNQYAGGTARWLKIRDLKRTRSAVVIEVRVRGRKMFMDVCVDNEPLYLKFAKGWPGLMPVSFRYIKDNYPLRKEKYVKPDKWVGI